MKIDKLQNDRNIKLVAHIPESTHDELEDYRKCYQEKYGTDITDSKLIAAMLQRFMTDDVEFQRWKKVQRAPKPATAPLPAPPSGAGVSLGGEVGANSSDDAQQF